MEGRSSERRHLSAASLARRGRRTSSPPQLGQVPESAPLQGPQKDNIFAAEFESNNGNRAAADAWLVVCIFADAKDGFWVTPVYDKLLD